ncbi:hypothetical protein D3C81_1282360 [compost metagenome]
MVPQPHLDQHLLPGSDQPRHRLAKRLRAGPRPLHVGPALLNQARTHEFYGQHTVQHDLRIDRKDLVRPDVQRLGDREGAL